MINITLLGALLVFTTLLYRYIIHPTFISSLSKIPTAHWSCSVSDVWIQYHRVKHINNFAVHEAHRKYGPVIRIAPNELSINCVDGGLRTIYTGGYEKGTWYSNVFNNYGIRPMFCMEDRGMHSRRKRMISNVYAKSTLQKNNGLSTITDIILKLKLLPRLQSYESTNQIIDIFDIIAATTMDIVSAYAVGLQNSSKCLDDLENAKLLIRAFKARQTYYIWPQELPKLTACLDRLGLAKLIVPPDPVDVGSKIETMISGMCERTEHTILTSKSMKEEDYPTVYAQLRTNMLKESSQSEVKARSILHYTIASELVDHIIAGFDTSSITLTWLAWELSRPCNIEWQKKLQAELALHADVDAKTLDGLPVLEAILQETLRLHAAIPGNQPRVTPENAILGPPGQTYLVPAGVRVQAQAWSLHRRPDVFREPDEWRPQRWLEASPDHHKEMLRWFWAFGSGGRMCVGSNLALYQMKAIIALIWSHFSTTVVFDEGMVPNGGYQAEPLGKDGRILEVQLHRI